MPPSELGFGDVAELFKRPSSHPSAGTNCLGWAAQDASGILAPFAFDRRAVGPKDVRIQIAYAGICHSDIHQVP